LAQLNSDLRDITDFDAVVSKLGDNVRRILRTDWVGIVLQDESENYFRVFYDTRGVSGSLTISVQGMLGRRLASQTAPMFKSTISTDPYLQAASEGEKAAIRELRAEMIVPLKASGELTGFMYLGPKLVGGDYSEAELDFVSAAADQSAMAINNARAYAIEAHRREELERLDGLKSILLQTVSHELKSPITAIKLSTELMDHVSGTEATEAQRERLVSTLKNGIQRLERLTSESLDYAAMQSAHLELNRQPVLLKSIIEQSISLLQPSISAREQKLVFTADERLHPLMIDEQRIERVVANLVGNAHKYSPKGALITVQLFAEGDDQVLRVIDEGPGIATDELEAVFSPYYRGKLADTSPVQGSGLGLSIAQYLTELHEGKLSVDSTLGAGSTFELRLPASSLDLLDDDLDETLADETKLSNQVWPPVTSQSEIS
jgi:signal transduction histidine kinase